ncbi:histidine phosphotransferase family protein [Cognatishimia sp. F0-27]|uniref:histidine phosphotransferase family protein n=1 Tax=Cognatishimia sp. F0-27 TaxID=2816855 RepID=UPI001D0C573D|nr:histidine phosphotransferase family protein [Cognatishimia sp. F0-27]MCC1491874.1 hypothetical protein [Cognatishimia sp. F0-27]
MTDPNASLASLVGSRLCHDLISPIGAIQNGLELLSLAGGDANAPEMTLIRESCESATARIRFFRVAFGSASENQIMSARDIASTLAGVSKGARMRGIWQVDGDLPRGQVQLAFLAHLCCETALPQGGEITVTRSGDDWTIRAQGPRIAIDESTWARLAGHGKDTPITPDRVQFVLLADLALQRGVTLATRTDEATIQIRMNSGA